VAPGHLAEAGQGLALQDPHHRTRESLWLARGADDKGAVRVIDQAGAARRGLQTTGPVKDRELQARRQGRRCGDGCKAVLDPVHPAQGEACGFRQAAQVRGGGHHLAAGAVQAQGDPSGATVDP